MKVRCVSDRAPKKRSKRKDNQLQLPHSPEEMQCTVMSRWDASVRVITYVTCLMRMYDVYVRTYIYFIFPQGPKEPPIGVLGEK